MRNLDLVSTRRRFFIFSGALVLISLLLLAIPPTLRPGIEFTSGTTTLLRFERGVDQAALREAYAELGHPEARIQSTGPDEYLIRTSKLDVPDTALIEVAPEAVESEPVDPGLGSLLLGAEDATGEIALRVFQFGGVCDFGDEIASVPAGSEALILEEVRGCEDPAAADAEGEDGETEAGDADAGDADAEAEEGDADAADGDAEADDGDADAGDGDAADEPEPELLAYRVQVEAENGEVLTGFVAPGDTRPLDASGDAEPEVSPEELGERGVIEAALGRQFGRFEVLEFASVSAVVSKQAVRNAAVAVVIASLFIMGYIIFAFSSMPHPFRYAMAGIIALIHDVAIVIGAFSLFGKLFGIEINLMFVTGLLTIIGFSVHDTIVIFDRVRENVTRAPTAPLAENVNAALVQTLGRSLNTSVTLLFTILALLWLGGSTIEAFLLVLLVGVIAGAYSSIAIAAQVLVAWEEGDLARLFARLRRREDSPSA